MEKRRIFALTIVLLLSGCSFPASVSKKEAVFKENTYILHENISEKSSDEVVSIIQSMIDDWEKNTSFTLTYHEKKITLPMDVIAFQIEKTVENIQNQQENEIKVNVQISDVKSRLKEQLELAVFSAIHFEELEKDLQHLASKLVTGEHHILLDEYIRAQSLETVSQTSSVIPVEYTDFVTELMNEHDEVSIPKHKLFSMHTLMNESSATGTDDEWSFLATAIYKAILPTNFDILKRTPHRSIPSYATLGQDVKVSNDEIDFVFYNPNDFSYTMKFSTEDGRLYIDLIGRPFPYTYEIEVENISYHETEPFVVYTEDMDIGNYYTEKKGVAAVTADVVRKAFDSNGDFVKKETISTEFYPGISGREVHGSRELEEAATDTLEGSIHSNSDDSSTFDGGTQQMTVEELKTLVEEIVQEKLENHFNPFDEQEVAK